MREIEKEDFGKDDLALAILNKNKSRASQADSFFDSLIDKYSKAADKTKKKNTPSKSTKKRKTNG